VQSESRSIIKRGGDVIRDPISRDAATREMPVFLKGNGKSSWGEKKRWGGEITFRENHPKGIPRARRGCSQNRSRLGLKAGAICR